MRADYAAPTHLSPNADAVKAALAGGWEAFYQQYTPLKKKGGEYRGGCPLHGGDGPNFAVDPNTGEWYCHSQCQQGGDALAFLERKEGVTFPEALARLADYAGVSSVSPPRNGHTNGNGHSARNGSRRLVKTYDYTDETGTLLYQAVRYEPKGFNQRKPDGNGGWLYSLGNVRRVLYRLPDVRAAVETGRAVYVCEGEKDADRLHSLGLCGTTNAMGADKWDGVYTESLSGANVVILPDNDGPGKKHAQKVAAALHGKAARVRVIELPGLPDKGDVSDWLAAGGTQDALAALASQTPEFQPPAVTAQAPLSGYASSNASPAPRPSLAARVIDLADIGPPPAELPLLFGPYLLKGAAHWLSAPTGMGKSTLAFNIACALAEGTPLWGIQAAPCRVLYVDCESGDVGRRLKLDRLYQGSPRVRDRLFFLPDAPRLPDEAADLLAFAQEHDIGLVILDTARRVFAVRDENDNAETYQKVVPLLDALKAAGIASLTMGHVSKNGNGSARGAGAQEDAGDVNLSLIMHKGETTDADGIVALKVTKNRVLGLGTPPLFLRRVGDDRFERVSHEEAGEAKAQEDDAAGKREQCQRAIEEWLATRPKHHAAHKDIIAAMQQQGYSYGTARRAREEMEAAGVLLRAEGGGYVLSDPFA